MSSFVPNLTPASSHEETSFLSSGKAMRYEAQELPPSRKKAYSKERRWQIEVRMQPGSPGQAQVLILVGLRSAYQALLPLLTFPYLPQLV